MSGPVVVVGASGGTGRRVVALALAAGRPVTALVRRRDALDARPGLRVVAGDVLAPDSLHALVRPGDAVVSALGIGHSRAATEVYSTGTANVVAAMARAGARRLVCVSTCGLEVGPGGSVVQRTVTRQLLQRMLRRPYADMRRMERCVRASGLDWTLVRAARLTDGAATGRYRVTPTGTAAGLWSVSRADLAAHLLAALDDAASVGTTQDLAY